MKNMYYKLLKPAAIAIFAALAFVSCESMNDKHRDFLEGGEKIYAPKVDSLYFLNGKNRVMMQFWLLESPNVRSVDVFWNNDADSLSIAITPNAVKDSMEVFIPLSEEKAYTFYVRTTDMFGNHSLRVMGSATSYGATYASALSNRGVKNAQSSGSLTEIQWYSAPDDFFCTEVRYTDINSKLRTVRTFANETQTPCPDAQNGTRFEARSLYLPNNSIDTFYMEWEIIVPVVRFDKSGWSVIAFSDQREDDGGGVNTLIDNNLDNYWHSQWGPNAPLPHWVIIDMAAPKTITKIDTYRRRGNTNSKTVEYYISDNPAADAPTWAKIVDGVFPGSGDLLSLQLPEPATGRYLKIYLPDSNNESHTSIAEIVVFGTE